MKYFHYAKQIVYGTEQTLMFTHEMCLKYKDSEAVFLEAGVAAGAHIIVMAGTCPDKKIYALDSYAGIPWASNRDDQLPGLYKLSKAEQLALPDPGKQVLASSGATVVALEHVKNHLTDAGVSLKNVVFVEGWFEETVPSLVIEPIAILRLDSDLFNSTWVCLQHLFPKCIPGACVIIDDIQLPGCKAAVDEYFELISYQPDWKYISDIAYFYK